MNLGSRPSRLDIFDSLRVVVVAENERRVGISYGPLMLILFRGIIQPAECQIYQLE